MIKKYVKPQIETFHFVEDVILASTLDSTDKIIFDTEWVIGG